MNTMNNQAVFKILQTEDEQTILTMLEALSPLDTAIVNGEGQTMLHFAVKRNQLEVAAWLLNKGSHPNQKDHTMLSPFIAAAAMGHAVLFQLLLLYQPDLTEVNRFGGTALLPSSEKGFLPVVQLALDAGVPVNHVNQLGWTALLEAVVLGNDGFLYQEIVEELVVKGADITIQDFDGNTAVDYAKNQQMANIYSILTEGVVETSFTEVKRWIRENDYYRALKRLLAMEKSLEQFYYLGVVYERLHQYDTAQFYYKKGFQEDPQFAYYLANVAKKQQHIEQVLSYYDQGAKESETPEFFIYHQSNVLREIDRHQEAIKLMDSLLDNNPDRVDYMFHKANSLRRLGQYQAAIDVMSQANLLQPANPLFFRDNR